jgi:hypothetical protein
MDFELKQRLRCVLTLEETRFYLRVASESRDTAHVLILVGMTVVVAAMVPTLIGTTGLGDLPVTPGDHWVLVQVLCAIGGLVIFLTAFRAARDARQQILILKDVLWKQENQP